MTYSKLKEIETKYIRNRASKRIYLCLRVTKQKVYYLDSAGVVSLVYIKECSPFDWLENYDIF